MLPALLLVALMSPMKITASVWARLQNVMRPKLLRISWTTRTIYEPRAFRALASTS